jgi:hypothetical protein
MSNLRVVYDNAADTSTITASTTSGTLAATNLLTDIKSQVWRSATSSGGVPASGTLTLLLGSTKTISCVSLPFSSLTNLATFNVKYFTLAGDASPAYTSGVKTAIAGSLYTASGGVNQYAYGGSNYATVWTPPTACQKVTVDISDLGNLGGYIEAARIVVGNYWSPTYSAEYGVNITYNDRTINTRTESGDLRSDRGTQNKQLSFVLDFITATDRNTLWNIIKRNGTYSPMFISLLPEDTDSGMEQIYEVYGKLSKS